MLRHEHLMKGVRWVIFGLTKQNLRILHDLRHLRKLVTAENAFSTHGNLLGLMMTVHPRVWMIRHLHLLDDLWAADTPIFIELCVLKLELLLGVDLLRGKSGPRPHTWVLSVVIH